VCVRVCVWQVPPRPIPPDEENDARTRTSDPFSSTMHRDRASFLRTPPSWMLF
jgi:hypothetical protein